MTILFHPSAQLELRLLAEWYESRREDLGEDLRVELWKALAVIAEHPGRWQLSPLRGARRLGVRHFPLNRFPLSLEYIVNGDEVLVVALAHMRRRPGYWVDRLSARAIRRRPRKK